ncbi:YwhD family protein [Salicibibacter cibarius]|uniref:YwhD family protein n=1 Tax=Salicibibacter cibarius TaxID=2743000 RepID=A0A7T6Z7F2_9BACI|nr:YwhD family protein [Salicibibacter cibarius]QQK78057.1 YwhD family protein [Salicibibacter cibarius]
MELFNKNKEKRTGSGFNILSGDSTDGHGGFGVGSLSLDHLTPVIIDPVDERVFIDMGAIHARSEIEKKVKLLENKEELNDPREYWMVWVTTGHTEKGEPKYDGVGACRFYREVEPPEGSRFRRGYKSMPEHVNNMDKALKGRVVVDLMDEKSRYMLREYLKGFSEEYWNNSDDQLKEALADS